MKKLIISAILLFGSTAYAGTKLLNPTNVPHGTLPATCSQGDMYQNISGTSGQQWYLCESTNTWVLEGGGGGGGGGMTPSATYYVHVDASPPVQAGAFYISSGTIENNDGWIWRGTGGSQNSQLFTHFVSLPRSAGFGPQEQEVVLYNLANNDAANSTAGAFALTSSTVPLGTGAIAPPAASGQSVSLQLYPLGGADGFGLARYAINGVGYVDITKSSFTVNNIGFTLAQKNCTPNLNGGKLTTDTVGNVVCADDISGAGGGGASFVLGVTSGTTVIAVVVSSPTSTIVVDSNTMGVRLIGGATAFITMNPSSVTLLGSGIILPANLSPAATFYARVALVPALQSGAIYLDSATLSQVNSSTASTNILNFNSTYTIPSQLAGRMFYDSSEDALAYYNNSGQVTMDIGQENMIRGVNCSGVTITNGSAVFISGSTNTIPCFAMAHADVSTTSVVAGVATMDIANNTTGYATNLGIVHSLNTSAFNPGDIVYLSSITPGGLTTTLYPAPSFRTRIGVVTSTSTTIGRVLVMLGATGPGFGSANQVRAMNVIGTQEEYKTITAGAGISVTASTGSITVTNTGSSSSVTVSSGPVFASTNTVTVTNSTTETSLQSFGYGSSTIAAGGFYVGQTFMLEASGYVSDAAVAQGTLQIRIRLAGSTIAATPIFTPTANQANSIWNLHTLITIRSIGASGTLISNGMFVINDSLGITEDVYPMINTTTMPIDTTQARGFDLTAQWGTASGSNVLLCTNFTLDSFNGNGSSGSGGSTPGGSIYNLQYSSGATLGGDPNFNVFVTSVVVGKPIMTNVSGGAIAFSSMTGTGIANATLTDTNFTLNTSTNFNTQSQGVSFRYYQSTHVINTADIIYTGSTLANTTGYAWQIGANEVWAFEANLLVVGVSGGTEYGFNAPAGGSVAMVVFGDVGAVGTFSAASVTALNTADTVAFTTVAGAIIVRITGTVTNSTTPGVATLMWKSVTNTNLSRITAGSYMYAHRIN